MPAPAPDEAAKTLTNLTTRMLLQGGDKDGYPIRLNRWGVTLMVSIARHFCALPCIHGSHMQHIKFNLARTIGHLNLKRKEELLALPA